MSPNIQQPLGTWKKIWDAGAIVCTLWQQSVPIFLFSVLISKTFPCTEYFGDTAGCNRAWLQIKTCAFAAPVYSGFHSALVAMKS